MSLPLISFSPAQILVGVLSAIIGIAGSYWFYRRSKRDDEIRWRTENIYDSALEELNAVIDEDEYPGTTRNRQEESFWDDIDNLEKGRLSRQIVKKGEQYYRRLGKLEKAENKFLQLNKDIVEQFPDDVAKIEGTEVQLLVGGSADFETETHGENPPEISHLIGWAGLGTILDGVDTDILNADSPEEVREFLIPEEGLEEHQYPDEPTFFMGGFRPEHLSFWEDEFPEWDECLYQAIDQGYVEEYLKARKNQYEVQQEVEELAGEIRDIIESEIESLNTDK